MAKFGNSEPQSWARWFKRGAALAICAIAAFLLWHTIRSLSISQVVAAVKHIGAHRILAALGFTAFSFLLLGTYDVLAARLVAPCVSAALAWQAGAVGNAISNTLGFHAVVGPAIRQRYYRRAGLGMADTARITSLSWAVLGLGFVVVVTTALLMQRAWAVAIPLFLSMFSLLYWLGRHGRTLPFVQLSLPSAPVTALQLLVGGLEMAAAIGGLYILLPSPPAFAAFAAAYVGAVLLGIISHAPGGIGVFEAAMMSLSGAQHRTGVLAALLLYRLIYNLIPFALGTLALAGFEANHRVNSKVDSSL